MTIRDFRTALAKGHGRAVLAFRENPSKYRHALLSACVRDPQYDAAFEDVRGTWLYEMVEEGGLSREYLTRLLAAFPKSKGYHRRRQIELLGHMAARGSQEAAATLRSACRKGESEISTVVDAVLAGEGLDGLGFLIRESVFQLPTFSPYDVYFAVKLLQDHHPRSEVRRFVETLGTAESAGFLEFLAEGERSMSKPEPLAPEAPWDIERLKSFMAGTQGRFRRQRTAKHVGQKASPDLLKQAADWLLSIHKSPAFDDVARVFESAKFPLDPALLLNIAASDSERRDAALVALSQVRHPAVRQAAWKLMDQIGTTHALTQLLATNYEPGDAGRILGAIRLDGEDPHRILFCLIDAFRPRSEPEIAQIYEFVYEHTPCALCRQQTVEWLTQNSLASHAILSECLHDSESGTRELAESALQVVG